MHLKKAEWCESWMTDEEKRIMKKQMAAMRRLFIKGGIPESPFISMRAIDIGIHHLMVRRLEKTLAPTINEDGETTSDINSALAEQIGKTRERLRKSMRELEEACARLGKPVQIGLADRLLPLVRETQHILHSDIWKQDNPVPDSLLNTSDILDDTTGSGNIPESDSLPNTPDISDSAVRSGDIPDSDSPPNTPDISDSATRSGDIPVPDL